jgi:hypothetical protein
MDIGAGVRAHVPNRPLAAIRELATRRAMMLKPAAKLKLAALARPVAIAFVPVAILLMAISATFWVIGAWLVVNGMLAVVTACSSCRHSIYWNERRPWKTILAEPHAVCTRCGFDFQH